MFEDLSDEWREWIALTPLERWHESQKLFVQYLAQGGSLDPDPDPDSPFYAPEEWRPDVTHGRAGLRVPRRGASWKGPIASEAGKFMARKWFSCF